MSEPTEKERKALSASELEEIKSSSAWRLVRTLWRLRLWFVPHGSIREVALLWAKWAIATVGSEGPIRMLREARPTTLAISARIRRDRTASSTVPGNSPRRFGRWFPTPRCFRVLIVNGVLDSDVSAHYRVFNLAEALLLAGIYASNINEADIPGGLSQVLEHDVLILFRVKWDERIEQLVSLCHECNIPVIFEIDDYIFDYSLVPRRYAKIVPGWSEKELAWYVDMVLGYHRTLGESDFFTGSTHYLVQRTSALGKESFAIRNGLSWELIETTRRLHLVRRAESNNDPITIVYLGGTMTHERDFNTVVPALVRILEERPIVELMVVGYLNLSRFSEFKPYRDRINSHSFVPWRELPEPIAGADINLAPLELAVPFSDAKSELKYFEAGALGLVTVASVTDTYERAIKDGETGLLCRTSQDWYRALSMLIEKPHSLKEACICTHLTSQDTSRKRSPISRHELRHLSILTHGSFLSTLTSFSPKSKANFLSMLKLITSDRHLRLEWKNCVPSHLSVDEELDFESPYLIPPHNSAYSKVAMQSPSVTDRNWRFLKGNHQAIDDNTEVVTNDVQLKFLDLLHVPLCSVDQFAPKCLQGVLSCDALPPERRDHTQGRHWSDMMIRISEQCVLSPNLVREFAAYYGQPPLCSDDGATVYDLLDASRICAHLEIAHLELSGEISSRFYFSQLSSQILEEHENAHLKDFLEITATGYVGEVAEYFGAVKRGISVTDFTFLDSVSIESLEFDTEAELLNQFISKAFAPHEMPLPSTWESHIPFLFGLMDFMKPRRFVALGTQYGNCFFAACQASRNMGWKTECIAMDNWLGDRRTGFYGEKVFGDFRIILDDKYHETGAYILKTFDEARLQLEANSIDLLHIDGLHTYSAVSHDFDEWLPTMSDRGVVMLHYTQEHEEDFGVWRLWSELESRYPSIEFKDGHSVGVVPVGNNPLAPLGAFFELCRQPEYETIL